MADPNRDRQKLILSCRYKAFTGLSPAPDQGSRAAEIYTLLRQAVASGNRYQYEAAEIYLRSAQSQESAKSSRYGNVDWTARDPAPPSLQALTKRRIHEELDAALAPKAFYGHPIGLEQEIIDELLQSTARHQLPFPAHTGALLTELVAANSAEDENKLKTAYVNYIMALRMQAEVMLLRRRVDDNLTVQEQKGAMTAAEKTVWLNMLKGVEDYYLGGKAGSFWPAVTALERRIKKFVGNYHLEQERLPRVYAMGMAQQALHEQGLYLEIDDLDEFWRYCAQLEEQGAASNESSYVRSLILARYILHRATYIPNNQDDHDDDTESVGKDDDVDEDEDSETHVKDEEDEDIAVFA